MFHLLSVAIDIAKLRPEVLIEAPGWKKRKRLVLLNTASSSWIIGRKRRIRTMPGFKKSAALASYSWVSKLMHMINKGQIKNHKLGRAPAQLFYSLAA